VEFQLLYEVGEFELENSLPQAHRSKLPRLHLLYKSVGGGGVSNIKIIRGRIFAMRMLEMILDISNLFCSVLE
jgi:hypothetical protein